MRVDCAPSLVYCATQSGNKPPEEQVYRTHNCYSRGSASSPCASLRTLQVYRPTNRMPVSREMKWLEKCDQLDFFYLMTMAASFHVSDSFLYKHWFPLALGARTLKQCSKLLGIKFHNYIAESIMGCKRILHFMGLWCTPSLNYWVWKSGTLNLSSKNRDFIMHWLACTTGRKEGGVSVDGIKDHSLCTPSLRMILIYVLHFSFGFFRWKRFKGRTRGGIKHEQICVYFSISLTSSGDSLEARTERKIRLETWFVMTHTFVIVLCITFDKLILFSHYSSGITNFVGDVKGAGSLGPNWTRYDHKHL